jgi:hypothetical protein
VAAKAREEKQSKEARAVERAKASASKRSVAKASERRRLADEELRGATAREAAIAQIQRKKADAVSSAVRSEASGKRKASPRASSSKQKKTSPHVADNVEEADGESVSSAATVEAEGGVRRCVLLPWCGLKSRCCICVVLVCQ